MLERLKLVDKDMDYPKETLENADAEVSTYPYHAECPSCKRTKFYSAEHFYKHTRSCTANGRRAWGIRTKRSHTGADRLSK